MSDFDDLNYEQRRVVGQVAQSAFTNIVDSLVDAHSAVVVLAITGALEVGALVMLVFVRDQVVASFALPNSTTYMWAYPVAIINGFLLSLSVCTLLSRSRGLLGWLISMAFGFLNGCILFVLAT